jgi:hypothetical protein
MTPSSITTTPAEEHHDNPSSKILWDYLLPDVSSQIVRSLALHWIVTSGIARLCALPSAHFHFAKHLRHNGTIQHRYSVLF